MHILLDALWINRAAGAQHKPLLPLVERNLLHAPAMLPGGRIHVEQPVNHSPGDQRLGDNLRHVFQPHFVIEQVLGQHGHERPHLAEALAAALVQTHLAGFMLRPKLGDDRQAGGPHLFHQGLEDLVRPAGDAAGSCTHNDPSLRRVAVVPVWVGQTLRAHWASCVIRVSTSLTALSGVCCP